MRDVWKLKDQIIIQKMSTHKNYSKYQWIITRDDRTVQMQTTYMLQKIKIFIGPNKFEIHGVPEYIKIGFDSSINDLIFDVEVDIEGQGLHWAPQSL